MGNPRFSFHSAVIGYTVAMVFAFNGLLTSVIDAGWAAGANPFAITCLGGEGQLPGQSDHAAKCSCTLSCCCASGELNRASHQIAAIGPIAAAKLSSNRSAEILRDFLSDHRHRPRPPPALG